jgi:excisionase family DNA binding protein
MARKKIDKLLNVRQVAKRLAIDFPNVYRIIKAGLLPCVRIGLGRGVIRVKESDLEAYIEGRKSDTTKTD